MCFSMLAHIRCPCRLMGRRIERKHYLGLHTPFYLPLWLESDGGSRFRISKKIKWGCGIRIELNAAALIRINKGLLQRQEKWTGTSSAAGLCRALHGGAALNMIMSSKDKSAHNKQRVQACLMRGLHPFFRQVAFSPSLQCRNQSNRPLSMRMAVAVTYGSWMMTFPNA